MLPLAFFGQLHQLYVDDMALLFRGEENWFLFILTNRLGDNNSSRITPYWFLILSASAQSFYFLFNFS